MDLKNLKAGLTTAAAEAKKLVAAQADGGSPFAASLRSNLDHAVALLAEHERWLQASAPPAPPAPPSPAAPKA